MLNLQNMRPGEKVLTVLKRHWIVYVILGVYFLVGIIISIIVYAALSSNVFSDLIIGESVTISLLEITFWLFFSVFLYIQWLNHELDMYVVTNNRVIGIDQISFLNRTVSECNLGQVQEVNSKTSGLFANILNYGTLSIQTAGNITTLKMDFCPNSIQEARKLLNIVDDYRDKKNITSNEETET